MSDVTILSQTRCELGEGPFFCERRNTLFWFDILGKSRYAYNFDTADETCLSLPEMASAMGVLDDRYDAVLTETGLWQLDNQTGGWSPLAPVEPDNEITRSNDARIHPSGAMWLGTMGKHAEPGAGAIYHYCKGEVTKLYDAITIPNAICFSPDGRLAYFTDTADARLMKVELDVSTGLPTGKPELFVDHRGEDGGLDGSVCDGRGTIWNARWGASCVDNYGPDGQKIASVSMPAIQVSCPAFIGAGRIAVTSAMQDMDLAARDADPHAGKTFVFDAKVDARFEPRLAV